MKSKRIQILVNNQARTLKCHFNPDYSIGFVMRLKRTKNQRFMD